MKFTTQRKAFSMITAIFVIVIMATVASFIMSLSSKMVKGTTTQFQREQAMLLSKSYTEYAIMAVMANDRSATGACLRNITGNNILNSYNVNVSIAYIGNDGTDPANNTDSLLLCSGATNAFAETVLTRESPLNVIIDVYVSYPDFDNPNDQNLTYHKRTLQKI